MFLAQPFGQISHEFEVCVKWISFSFLFCDQRYYRSSRRYYRRPVLPALPGGTTVVRYYRLYQAVLPPVTEGFSLPLDASFSLADFFPFSLFVFRVFVAISTQASASKSSALIDTATLEHHPPPTVASPQQYQRYNLRHFDSPISSFVCIYPMRATHFVFV